MRRRNLACAVAVLLGIGALVLWMRGDESPRRGSVAPAETPSPSPASALAGPSREQGGSLGELESAPVAAAPAPGDPAPPREEPVDLPPELAPLLGAGGEPTRELVQVALERELARHHPDLEVTPGDLERASDAALRIRALRQKLSVLAFAPEHAAERARLEGQLATALEQFTTAMQLSPSEFTELADTPDGIDTFDPNAAIPEPSYIGESPPQEAE